MIKEVCVWIQVEARQGLMDLSSHVNFLTLHQVDELSLKKSTSSFHITGALVKGQNYESVLGYTIRIGPSVTEMCSPSKLFYKMELICDVATTCFRLLFSTEIMIEWNWKEEKRPHKWLPREQFYGCFHGYPRKMTHSPLGSNYLKNSGHNLFFKKWGQFLNIESS